MAMILVDKRVTNLIQGYDRLHEAERTLADRWRHRLLTAYARQRAAYDAAAARHRARTLGLGRAALAAAAAGAALLLAAGLFFKGAAGWQAALAVGGLAVCGAGVAIWLWQGVLAAPRRPAHPLRGSLRARLFPALLPRWYDGLQGRLPADMPYTGATGEYELVSQLAGLRGVPGFLLYRLRQRPGDDVDVAVVGSKGVWVFEVKYWSGQITWGPGGWHREKSYYARGGQRVTEDREISQPPDEQWQRMAVDVAETLRRREPRLIAAIPALARIGGGLAFTHPEATYDIAPGCPCAWGTIGGWKQQMVRAPAIAGVTARAQVRILDALLARHREFAEIRETLSMDAYAAQLVRHVENELAAWLRAAEGAAPERAVARTRGQKVR
jgi:Nuclease-related domain